MQKKASHFENFGVRTKAIWILLLSFVFVPASAFGQNFPGKTWEKIENPEKYGFSSMKLEQMDEILKSMDTASFLVIKDGKILYEFGDHEQKYFTHSARKSFMSTLYGIYVENGAIDLNESMADLGIDDDPPLSETEKKATILNCLMARSGIYHASAAESASMKAIKPERYSKKPGEYWVYNNWDFNVLYTIFEQETGHSFYEALKSDIFDKIGTEYFVEDDKYLMYVEESKHPAYHFKITARDMARFGLMMLHGGKWKEKQIIPEDWVKEITEYQSDASLYGRSGYGYITLGYMFCVPTLT